MLAEHKADMQKVQDTYTMSFNEQRATYEKTMNQVVTSFNGQIETSNSWHESHRADLQKSNERLGEILTLIKTR